MAKLTTLTQKVIDEILRRIYEKGLRPGDCLGTEVNIAEELKVSRNILREAVSRLRGIGIIESRQNQGIVVVRTDPVGLFEKALPFYAVDGLSFLELAELRYCLEIGAVELAAKNATKEQIEELKRLASEYFKKTEDARSDIDTDPVDAQFHASILKATGNSFLGAMHGVISKYFQRAMYQIEGWGEREELGRWEHVAIAEAIEQGDKHRARTLLSGHLIHVLDNLRQKIKTEDKKKRRG